MACFVPVVLQALIDSCNNADDLANEPAVRAVAMFDHEEVRVSPDSDRSLTRL
jgi:hypothetical protein